MFALSQMVRVGAVQKNEVPPPAALLSLRGHVRSVPNGSSWCSPEERGATSCSLAIAAWACSLCPKWFELVQSRRTRCHLLQPCYRCVGMFALSQMVRVGAVQKNEVPPPAALLSLR